MKSVVTAVVALLLICGQSLASSHATNTVIACEQMTSRLVSAKGCRASPAVWARLGEFGLGCFKGYSFGGKVKPNALSDGQVVTNTSVRFCHTRVKIESPFFDSMELDYTADTKKLWRIRMEKEGEAEAMGKVFTTVKKNMSVAFGFKKEEWKLTAAEKSTQAFASCSTGVEIHLLMITTTRVTHVRLEIRNDKVLKNGTAPCLEKDVEVFVDGL